MDPVELSLWLFKKRGEFIQLATEDPGLPEPFGNRPFSHGEYDLEQIEKVRSPQLPESASFVIIGSGITGCSVAHTLLHNEAFKDKNVVVLEARELASGATGHSAGQLATASFKDWADIAKVEDKKTAKEVAEFSYENLRRLDKLVNQQPALVKEYTKFKRLTMITNLLTQEIRAQSEPLELAFRQSCDELGDLWQYKDAEYAEDSYWFRKTQGVLEGPGASLQPGKLVAGIFKDLLAKFPFRLRIETRTPVKTVEDNTESTSHPCLVITDRGPIKASHIIYCVNGWTSHLLPHLKGSIFPIPGTVTKYDLSIAPPNVSNKYTWTMVNLPSVDVKTNVIDTGRDSITQELDTNDFSVRGELLHLRGVVPKPMTNVDSTNVSYRKHHTIMKSAFSAEKLAASDQVSSSDDSSPSEPTVKARWTSLMAFTPDLFPLVGCLPAEVTDRKEGGEWIAAGCDGNGLDKCWLMGEAIVNMIKNGDASIPSCYLTTDDRLDNLDPGDFLPRWLRQDTYEPYDP
ncbi:FAD dependent oxidoreductase [Aspergillus venezuelensis]